MSERGYQWFTLLAGFHSWASLIGFDAFTGDWLMVTCIYSAVFWCGYFCCWCLDPNELPRMLFETHFSSRKVLREADALRVSIEYLFVQGRAAR